MNLLKNKEAGQALVMVLILLAVGSFLVVSVLNLSFTNLNLHQIIERKTLEGYSADSGVKYALSMLYNNPNTYHDDPLLLSFTINDRAVNVTAEYVPIGFYKITSTATSVNGRSTTIESYVKLDVGAFTYVVAAKENMVLGNTIIDSSPDPGEGHIHSNWDIEVGGQVLVNGNASAVNLITWDDPTWVTGMAIYPSPPIQFPGDYSELYRTMAQAEGDYRYQDVILSGGTLEDPILFGPTYIVGNLTIAPNSFVRLTGTVYVTDTIEVKPGARLDGEENILAEQNITIEGGEYVSERIPIVTSTATGTDTIYCTGSGASVIINAVIYAPNGEVNITGKAQLYGAVGGKTVKINNATIIYAEELQGRDDLPGGEFQTITYTYK